MMCFWRGNQLEIITHDGMSLETIQTSNYNLQS